MIKVAVAVSTKSLVGPACKPPHSIACKPTTAARNVSQPQTCISSEPCPRHVPATTVPYSRLEKKALVCCSSSSKYARREAGGGRCIDNMNIAEGTNDHKRRYDDDGLTSVMRTTSDTLRADDLVTEVGVNVAVADPAAVRSSGAERTDGKQSCCASGSQSTRFRRSSTNWQEQRPAGNRQDWRRPCCYVGRYLRH